LAATRTTIIIPNYNGVRHLEALLPSIVGQTRAPARVLLVDNGSTDNSIQYVAGIADCLPLRKNHGFAYAVNRGIEAADTEFVAILNNDVILHPDWLAHLEDRLEDPSAHFACPLLLSASSPGRADGAYDLLSRSGCALRAFHGAGLDAVERSRERVVHFPPMTAALFRRDLFTSVGLLDECFRSYLEDVEFGLRAARQGYTGRFVPEATATHIGSATLGAWSARTTALIARNQILLLARHYPASLLRRWWWPILAGNLLYVLLALRQGQGIAALQGKMHALRLWSTLRNSASGLSDAESASHIARLVSASEAQISSLVNTVHPDRFWKVYFKLCPGTATLQNEK
jgi:GT2 family glycosyltransferase